MKNLVLHRSGESSFITFINKRLRNNLNFICLFSGATGIGKTWNGISLAYQLDPEFDAEKQITFDFKETMQLVNSSWLKGKKLKVILWDEPQISVSNRSWQSLTNKLMNYLLSTFRHQNIVLIFCAPYKDFLDSQAMKLLHCIFECQGVNRKKKLSKVRPKIQQYNAMLKKTYQHPLYVIRDGKVRPLRVWDITKPPQKLIDIYERRKTEFTSRLNKEIESQLDNISTDGSKVKPLTELQEKILACWKQGTFKQKEIGKLLKKPQSQISMNEGYMFRKGHIKENYKESNDI